MIWYIFVTVIFIIKFIIGQYYSHIPLKISNKIQYRLKYMYTLDMLDNTLVLFYYTNVYLLVITIKDHQKW